MEFSTKDTIAVYGDQKDAIQAMIDYDYYCGKDKTSVVSIIDPSLKKKSASLYFFGNQEIMLPAFPGISQAVKDTEFTILVNFASSRSAFGVTKEAIETKGIEKIIVIAEGVAERQARILKGLADKYKKVVIGPATVGGLIADVVKIGNAGGTIENVVEHRLYKRGNVGIVSKSGGMLNELMTIASRNTNGVCEAIAIGGDRFPITTLSEQVLRFEKNKDIKLIMMLGEVGGTQEYEIAKLVKDKKITKPIVAWIAGTGASLFKENIQFGHAGAMANSASETAEEKLQALKEVGVLVPDSFAAMEVVLREQAKKLKIGYQEIDEKIKELPSDFEKKLKKGEIRYKKNFVTSISKKNGTDETYLGKDIAKTSETQSIGYIAGLMWFKKEFPKEICEIFELYIKLCVDHGPSVSGAHNTIVAARAGKDLVSSLVSGLLTIGPRFGGAVNDSAYYFKWGFDTALPPFNFVDEMKKKGLIIPGIGHKVKSKTNPDKRVELLINTALKNLKKHDYLDYALAVETVTTRKKDSLILNIDGAIASITLDILSSYFSSEEIDDLIKMEALNAFFVLGRSIGLIGHFIDQQRLDQGLYRVPEWDILEVD